MRSSTKTVICAELFILAALCTASPAAGQTVTYSNLGPGDVFDGIYSYSASMAFPSSTAEVAWRIIPAQSGRLISGKFGLFRESSLSPAVLSVYDGDTDSPGTLLRNWTLTLPGYLAPPVARSVPLADGPWLEQGHMYFVSIKAGPVGAPSWRWYSAPRLPNGQFPVTTMAERPGTGGAWDVFPVDNTSGFGALPAFSLLINLCGTSDFDGDGDFGTDFDIQAFFQCLGGNCCSTCFSGGADFNGDGDTGTDRDIESFFSVLGGGRCAY